MFTTWNKTIRRIWNLPTYSHTVHLCGLNEGNHVYDYVFNRSIKMYNSMKCKNTKMVYRTLLAKNDKRSIISKTLQFICETANTKESEVINGYKSHVYKRADILRHEQTIAMIVELNYGIHGFDNDEIQDILYYISTI